MMTTKQLQRLKQLNAEGMNDRDIASALGVSYNQVFYWRRKMNIPASSRKYKSKVYAVYLRKTDELVAMGTADECAAAMCMTSRSFRSTMSKVKRGVVRKWEIAEVEKE